MRLAARFCNAGKASGGMRLHPPGGGEGGRDGRGWHVRFAQPEACPGTRAGGDDGSFGRGTSQRVPGNKAPNCCRRGGLPGSPCGALCGTTSDVKATAPARTGGGAVGDPASPRAWLRNGHGGAARVCRCGPGGL